MIQKQDIFTIMGGGVKIHRGPYNPTSDAVWLAAFIDGTPKTVLDVGTGTGGVALCLMARIPGIQMTALDISDEMLAAAKQNFELNGKTADFINADILSWRTNKTFDLVITNPPYFRGIPARHNAHHNADLTLWTRRCIARTRPTGTFATIVDATAMAPVISEMSRHCGDIKILPLFSNKNIAERVLLSARVGRAPTTTLYSGLAMNCPRILRDGASVAT
ncbi:MAG: methyltransferase, partial [Alphaproteobacteria bacterium]|nr:methyltransferase [Alphaproteobacteria bacterium]